MDRERFSSQLQEFERRAGALIRAFEEDALDRTRMGDVLAELSTSMEELRVAEEEMIGLNRRLEGVHADVEAERRRYQDLFLSAPGAYLVTDERGSILEGNHAASELLEVPIQHMAGKPLPFFVAVEDRPRTQQWLRQIKAEDEGAPDRLELRIHTIRSDRAFPAELSFWRIRDGRGTALRWALVDLSDRERARERDWFEEQAVRKDQFLAVLGHELRNPLAAIDLASQVMASDGEAGQGRSREAVRMIQRHIGHLTRLVDDLLDVSRVYHGKINLAHETIDMHHVVNAAAESSRLLYRQKGHELAIHRETEALTVDGDPLRLQQVITNLLDNAAKYTPEGGRIEVRLRRVGDRAIVGVRDFGIGIPPAALNRIFDMFEQVGVTTTTGLGIGLSLARELVKLHGGTIEARSDGLNRGSEFIISLPLADSKRVFQPASSPASSASAGDAVDVLIVDDNCDAADLLSEGLASLGHRVTIAYSAEQALYQVSGCTVALIDLAMPVMDGFALASKMRRLMPRLRLIALTGFSDDTNRTAAQRAGFQQYVLKPVNLGALDALLRVTEPG